MDLLRASASELARLVRRHELSPLDLVETHIRRIEAVNPKLNALVVEVFERARSEARQKTEELVHRPPDELPGFFGVPFTVKELISVRGLPFTAGVVARKKLRGLEDAPLVARLRRAGAILLGLTNVAEAGLWLESHNKVYGRTNNAHRTTRIAGGSSGGEAAIIAAGGSPMGIGADVGGSIRNPSFFNGICGHKPSGGLLPSTGHWPPAEGERGRICVSGPMARSVRDLTAMMEVFSLPSDPYRDPGRGPFLRSPEREPRDHRIFFYDDNGLARPSPEVSQAVYRTARLLRERGFEVELWRPEGLRRSAEIWSARVAASAGETVRELLGDGEPISIAKEWARMALGRPRHPAYSLVMATLEPVSRLGQARTQGLVERGEKLRSEIEAKLGSNGVLLCPPYPRPAPRHHEPLLYPLAFSYCGIFNALELPATAVPTGWTADGLPLGVQVVGPRFADPLTLWVAGQIEEACGGFRLAEPRP